MATFRLVPFSHLSQRIVLKCRLFKIACLSLTYNEHLSWNYVFDTLMEPAIWFVDSFTKILGPLFVTGVLVLTSCVVFIAYYVGLPYYLEHKHVCFTTFLVLLGNYIKVNVIFHYYHAYFTRPGRVPTDASEIKIAASICKKCIAPKPPRTHHCSVCDACILKMDHHCPWINGCIGHFNHRYFFLFMAWMVAGCFFVMLFGFEIFYDEIANRAVIADPGEFSLLDRRSLIWFEAFITTGTFFILGGLLIWHANLIHKGETSIEAHINKAETRRLKREGKIYRNAYDFTPWYNWCLFLGMIEGRGWSSVFVPSKFPPKGNGLEWDTVYSCEVKWNSADWYPIDASKMA